MPYLNQKLRSACLSASLSFSIRILILASTLELPRSSLCWATFALASALIAATAGSIILAARVVFFFFLDFFSTIGAWSSFIGLLVLVGKGGRMRATSFYHAILPAASAQLADTGTEK